MANFSDDFAGLAAAARLSTRTGWADHTSYTGAHAIGTTSPTGAVRVDTVGSGTVAVATTNPGAADYSVSVDLVFPSSLPAGDSFGVMVRCDTASDTFYRVQWQQGPGNLQYYKNVSGVLTSLGVAGTVTVAGSSTHTLKLAVSGTSPVTLQAYWDGSAIGSPVTDSAISAAGRAGVTLYADQTAGATEGSAVHLDNFAMTAGAAGATAFTLTGPSAGPAGAASTVFAVTPTGGTTTGTFTPNALSGVSYTPATLTWAGDASTKTFTVNKTAAATALINGTFSTGETPPASVSYTAKTTTTRTYTVQGGTAGVTTFYTIKNVDGTAFGARTSTGVSDLGGGTYSVTSAVVPADYAGSIVWDQGGSAYAVDGLAPPASVVSSSSRVFGGL